MPHRRWERRLVSLGGALLLLTAQLFVPVTFAAPPRQDVEARIEAIMAEMTTAQKVAQLFMVSLWGEALTDEGREFLTTYNPGGVILFGYNVSSPAQITRLTNSIQQASGEHANGIPAWIAIDQEGGVVSRLPEGFTTFPVSMAVAATGDPAYARAMGAAMAEEMRAVGITMDLAPVADVETNPNNPVIARRAFSADPRISATMVAATIEGLQGGGVMATAKHFPGHGDTGNDSHVELPIVPLDRERLESVELVPFRDAITADVGAIMVAHIWYPALDPTPDMPASLSYPVITGLLREELGFNGLIMTDALDMNAIDQQYSLARAAVLAVQAGADLITPGPHAGLHAQRAAIEAVISAVEDGTIPLSQIEDSVRRILRLKAHYGVLDWLPLDPETVEQRINREAHEQLVQEILAAAVTLAYDSGSFVPLDSAQRISLIYPATYPSIGRICEAYDPDLRLLGVSEWPVDEEFTWATSAAQWADVTVVFTYDAYHNPAQQQLVRSLPPERTIVVALRSPYDRLAFPRISAYMLAYTPLSPAIQASCAALFGAQPIGGVLPVPLGDDLPAGSGLRRP